MATYGIRNRARRAPRKRPATKECLAGSRRQPLARRRGSGHGWTGGKSTVAALCLLAGLSLSGAALRLGPSTGQEAELPLSVDYSLRIYPRPTSRDTFEAPKSGPATLLLRGLIHGGVVDIRVNGSAPASVELLASGGLALGKADCALITAPLNEGSNEIWVSESDGVQVVRVPGTNRWFATATQSGGSPMFSADLDAMLLPMREYPVTVYYGPRWRSFLWFSGRWDYYYGEVFGNRIVQARGNSGADAATLSYTFEDTRRNLVMPTQLTLIPDPGSDAFTIRVRQVMRAIGEPAFSGNLEFLHLKIDGEGAMDWRDGVPDYSWYRTAEGGSPDALVGSRTGMVRMDDNSFRTYRYRSSSADPAKTSVSNIHHTGAVVSLGAVNTIGGFLTKTGVGCCAWVFHRYQASFRSDLYPLHGHCGDGADTHFYLHWGEMFAPVGMRAGDKIDIEYSLTMLPSEATREDIEDLNEADLYLFGGEREQAAPITAWIGTKSAIGLQRGDGSLILLGIGSEPGRVAVPAASQARAQNVYRVFDLPQPSYEMLAISRGAVEVRPQWFTVVDCGGALQTPPPMVTATGDRPPEVNWDILPEPVGAAPSAAAVSATPPPAPPLPPAVNPASPPPGSPAVVPPSPPPPEGNPQK